MNQDARAAHVTRVLKEAAAAHERMAANTGPVVATAAAIATTLKAGGAVLVFGNGGSAADAQHLAAELVGRFKVSGRRGLPVLSLTSDTAVLTAWANDVGYEDVFARQVEALGRPGDVLVGISTSGRSRNVVRAFEAAARLGLRRVALLGGDGGDLRALADLALIVPSSDTQHIQEVHTVLIHLVCELVERRVLAGRAEPRRDVGNVRALWQDADDRRRARAA